MAEQFYRPSDHTRSIRDVLVDHGRVGTIVKGMRREQYDSINGMNFSSLKTSFVGNDEIDAVIAKETYEQSRPAPSQDLQDSYDSGTFLHMILLQPEEVASRVAVFEGKVRHGAEWEDFKSQHTGKLIMRAKAVREVQTACRSIRTIPEVRELLKPCDTEVAVFTQEGKIYCKALLDAVTREDVGVSMILDPKSTRHGISEHDCERTIRDLFYAEQMASYRRAFQKASGREIDKVKLIFVALPPQRLGVRVVTLTTAKLQIAESRVLRALERLEECIERDLWPTFYAESICDAQPWELDDIDIEGI